MLRAAAGPWCSALSQCSTRSRPSLGWSWLATSPAAKIPGTLVSRRRSTRMPLPTASPAAAASTARGVAPIPTTTASQAIVRPSCRADALDSGVALERLHGGSEQHLDAAVEVDVAVDRADLRTEYALERHRMWRDDGHVDPALARGGGHLGPDPAGADDDESAAGVRRARSASLSASVRR